MEPNTQMSPDQRATEAMRSAGAAMMKVVYDAKVSKSLLDIVQKAEDPAQGIAQAAMTVITEVASKVKGMGQGVAYAAGPVAVAAITELALAAGIIKDDTNILRGAMEQVAMMLKGRQAQPAAQPQEQPGGPQGTIAGGMMQPQEA